MRQKLIIPIKGVNIELWIEDDGIAIHVPGFLPDDQDNNNLFLEVQDDDPGEKERLRLFVWDQQSMAWGSAELNSFDYYRKETDDEKHD